MNDELKNLALEMGVDLDSPESIAHRATCETCQFAEVFQEIKEKLPHLREALNKIWGRMECDGVDAVYYRELYEGTWGAQTVEWENEMQRRRIANIEKRLAEEQLQ